MLCRRVVIMLCLCDGVLFRTKRFVPDYRYTTALVGNRNADEVVVVDVTPAERRAANRHLFYEALQRYGEQCYSPITAGGGIRTLEEVKFLMRECSTDKVVIGAEHLQAGLGYAIAHKFGDQALVAAVNHGGPGAGRHAVPDCAGEVLLNSVDRDGSLMGYDLIQLRVSAHQIDTPIMVAGGCGAWRHMAEAFDAGASAACTSVIHHLTEPSMAACKTWLAEHRGDWRVRAAA